MRVVGLICLSFFLLTLAVPRTLWAQGVEIYGTRISSLDIDGAPASVLNGAPLQSGDLLTREGVHQAIQFLYDRRGYSRIEVDAFEGIGDGTRLVFRVEEPYFLADVTLEPRDALERSLSSYMTLPYGERFSGRELDEILTGVRDQLEAEGSFGATVTPISSMDGETHLVHVRILVEAGPPARVGQVRFTGGEQTFGEDDLVDAFDVSSGDRFRADRIREGEDGLRALFGGLEGRAGFLDTRVEVRQSWNPDTNLVDLAVEIEPGSYTYIDLRGTSVSDETIRDLIPVFEEGSVDDDLVEEGRLNLQEYLRRQGYFEAVVTAPPPIRVSLDPNGSEDDLAIQIIYDAVPGDRYSVESIEFAGNSYFADKMLLGEIGLSKRGIFSRGVFSPDLMLEAERTIQSMYAAEGFSGARVRASSQTERNAIRVTVQIEEGVQLRVNRISVEGNTVLTNDEVILAGDVFQEEVYRPGELEAARRAVITRYHARGYPDANVRTTAVPNDSGVAITYSIGEGSHFDIGRIVVVGNARTRSSVVCRHAALGGTETYDADAGICRQASGAREVPFDPEAVLDSQRRLYASGLFDRVDVVAFDQGQPDSRDLLIHVEDAAPLLLTYGVGVQQGADTRNEGGGSNVDVRGTIELSHNNLWGLDRSLSARIQGSRSEQRFQTTYREPQLFNWDVDGFLSLLAERTETTQYQATRLDFSLQSLYQFSNADNLLLTASFQNVDLEEIKILKGLSAFEDETGTVQVATLGGSWVRDTRNDPINPSRGNYFSGSFRIGNGGYGSEVDFTSLFTQASLFRPAKATVIAGSARFGWNQPYGESSKLPITERYFAGGSTTLRAFGVDDAGLPGGGNAIFLLNLEYRFPIPFVISNLSGAVFYDTGTIFPEIQDFSIGDFTHTAGFGLRYMTPLGPVRVDLGFNLNRQAARSPGAEAEPTHKFHFTLGHAF